MENREWGVGSRGAEGVEGDEEAEGQGGRESTGAEGDEEAEGAGEAEEIFTQEFLNFEF